MLFLPHPSQAASGAPDSAEFGYGARLDPLGIEVDLALKAAGAIGIDWIGIDLNWARLWTTQLSKPIWKPSISSCKMPCATTSMC